MNLNKTAAGKPDTAECKWSELTLERYRLGELDTGEKRAMDEALAADSGLQSRLDALDESDRELRRLYPMSFFHLDNKTVSRPRFSPGRRVYMAGLAALLLVCFLLPATHFLRGVTTPQGADRPKGLFDPQSAGGSPELSLYLKGEGEILLHDMSVLKEGNTVQLAYTAPAGTVHYGVIFSIDGRSQVTMHYPYRRGQSSLLVSGRQTFLDEAYILDDAPDYEVFVMLVSDKPFDTDTVLGEAKKVADNSSGYMQVVEAFEGRDAEVLTVIKK